MDRKRGLIECLPPATLCPETYTAIGALNTHNLRGVIYSLHVADEESKAWNREVRRTAQSHTAVWNRGGTECKSCCVHSSQTLRLCPCS